MQELREQLARDVTRVMVKRGISQADLARSMHTARATIHRIIHPDLKGGLTLDTLSRVATALNLHVTIRFTTRSKKLGRPRKPVRLYRWGHWGKTVKVRHV